ncbi:MAG: sulfotransferase [Deltaproteobacteria bacterium]|nr:sulfotransferase [Deltaproteobacteria bacterium]
MTSSIATSSFEPSPARRIFLVGCPRSGTTLLQSMLAAHSELATFPETHFFAELRSRHPRLARMGVASRRARARVSKLLDTLGENPLLHLYPRRAVTIGSASRAFIRLLDALALRQNKIGWVEKTPRHLHFISTIDRFVDDARFVHLVRRGEDVALSLLHVAERYEEWNLQGLPACADRWNRDLKITARMIRRPRHTLVRYEQLIEQPESTLRTLCAALGLPFELQMISGSRDERIVGRDEPWKSEALSPIKRPEARFQRLDPKQRSELRAMLLPLEETLGISAADSV